MRKFLTARWLDLVMANYEVDPSLLTARVPAGTELDLHKGKCFVSLVGFMFVDTKVSGIPVPFHRNFEEVNLRFYVRRDAAGENRRGVVFVKEIVPRHAIAWVARSVYGEPYECWTMGHEKAGGRVCYWWERNGRRSGITVQTGENLGVPADDSHGSFIIEHYWGYTSRPGRRTDEYKVEHPKWELFSTVSADIDVDFGEVYGEPFAFLSDQKPYSVLLAKGSEISVYKGARLLNDK